MKNKKIKIKRIDVYGSAFNYVILKMKIGDFINFRACGKKGKIRILKRVK